jgi:hypothetical protein
MRRRLEEDPRRRMHSNSILAEAPIRQMGWTAPSGIDAIMRVVRTGNKGAAHDEH